MKITLFKTFTALICTVILTINGAGFAAESEKALPAKTPYNKQYVDILWNTKEGENVGVPIADGETLLLPSLNKILKLSEKDGNILGIAELSEKVSTEFSGAVLDGRLIQPARTSLFAVDTNSMEVIGGAQFGEITTDVGITADHAYFGYKTDNENKFICADINNGFEKIWEYSSAYEMTSPTFFDDWIIFASGSSLIVHSPDNEEYVSNDIGAEITHVFTGKYAVFMTAKNGSLYKLRLNDDGTAEEDSLISCEIGGTLTAPAELDNRVYVSSDEGFFVIDGLNMEVRESYTEMKNASAPVICYGNGQRVYTAAPHSDPSGDRWYLYSILDSEDELTVSEVAKIIDFSNGKVAVSQSGIMYFRDAHGQLWAIAETHPSVFMMILKVVLMLIIITLLILILRAWAKRRSAKRPPQY